jgi:hypothetical protein
MGFGIHYCAPVFCPVHSCRYELRAGRNKAAAIQDETLEAASLADCYPPAILRDSNRHWSGLGQSDYESHDPPPCKSDRKTQLGRCVLRFDSLVRVLDLANEGVRWYAASLMAMAELITFGALFIAGMSVSGDWI